MSGTADRGGPPARRTVLLVEHDRGVLERLGEWLEEAGFQVMVCPGPTAPSYTCIGGEGGPCPLVRAADGVVLDPCLASDAVLTGTSAVELLSYYVSTGKPLVAFTGRDSDAAVRLFGDDGVVFVRWPPDRRELVETVRVLLERPRAGPPRAARRLQGDVTPRRSWPTRVRDRGPRQEEVVAHPHRHGHRRKPGALLGRDVGPPSSGTPGPGPSTSGPATMSGRPECEREDE
jgi:DNA-binding response OmpR family regulator